MINVLFIAYEFPPLNSGGVHRSLGFVKYLKEFDVNPVVVTLSQKSYPKVLEEFIVDQELGKDVLASTEVIPIESEEINILYRNRVKNFIDIYFNILGREAKGWEKNFKSAIPGIMEKYKPAAVFVSVPPFSILKLARWVSKQYHLPLLSDFRDAWSQWRLAPYGSRLHYLATLRAEKKYLTFSNAVIATSQQTLSEFKRLHPRLDKKKFHLITNGFDGEFYPAPVELAQKEKYTIGYVGSFYYDEAAARAMSLPWWRKKFHRSFQYIIQKQDWLYRSPYFFFKSFRKLIDLYPEYGDRIQVKIAGHKPPWINRMINEFGLSNNIQLLGVLPHKDSLEFQKNCDALLLTSSKVVGGRDYSIAGKTFEYFKMQKPIIAFVCEGAQKDLLEESGMAIICDPDNESGSARLLKDFFERKISIQPDHSFLAGITRRKLTEKLSDIIKSII